MEHTNRLFPIFVKMEQFRVLIVGGGAVGLEKLTAILRNSPATPITLVAPDILAEIQNYVIAFPKVILKEKDFELSDLNEQNFVIAATDDKILNTEIKKAAAQKGILTNVADTPDECDFYLASIVQKGDLKIAISTNGKSPTIAKRLKEVLNAVLPTELDAILQDMTAIRQRLQGNFAEKVKTLNKITKILAHRP
jgi:siroheme synthase-like protein